MKLKIEKEFIFPEEMNELYKEGYRYIVDGDFEILEEILDPWSGMPNTTHNIYAFTDKAEAEAFAETQLWGYIGTHPKVKELKEHTETFEERRAREDKEKAERKAKREEKEAYKAFEVGMTVEEYRKYKARKSQITRVKNEIKRLEDQLANLKETLAELEA